MEAIILAGGKGTRLGSRLQGIPKPMALISGRPFLEIVLARLSQKGCSRVILSVGHLYASIRDYFGSRFERMPIDYAVETEPLGTGGAIREALKESHAGDVLVMNGDTFVDVDYADMLSCHLEANSSLSVAVVKQPDRARYGGVTIEQNRIVSFLEKGISGPGWINAGVYALKSKFVLPVSLPKKFSFESDFMVTELARLRPLAYRCSGYFLDIGIPEDLDRAQHELASR